MKKVWKLSTSLQKMKLKTLDLFSGIGGFARGLEATNFFETSCFVETEPYCQAVLNHHWPDVPILGDIKNVKATDLPTRPDVICGGFPCQPYSVAGRQEAQSDSRHLWPEMFRLIRECRPTWIIGENVTGLISLGLDEVLADLESEGYATRTFNISACSVGAPHLRQRLWIIAHSDSESEPDGTFDGNARQRQLGFDFVGNSEHDGLPSSEERGRLLNKPEEQKGQKKIRKSERASNISENVADSSSSRLQKHGHGKTENVVQRSENVADSESKRHGRRCGKERGTEQGVVLSKKSKRRTVGSEVEGCSKSYRPEQWWEVEPDVGRLVNGLPNRVSQLRALGNSIVPQIAQQIGEAIKETYDVYG